MTFFTRMTATVLPTIPVILFFQLAACGVSEEKKHAYRNAETIKPLEIPPGLELAQSRETLVIPEQNKTTIASVDELESPPRIIESASLEVLEDKDKTPAATAEKANKTEPAAKITAISVTSTRNDKGDSILLADGVFDQVWPLVKPALIELGFTIDDSSRGQQMYAISKELPEIKLSDKPVHPGDEEPPVKEEFQIHVKPVGERTRITVHNKLGQLEGSGLADHLLLQIKQVMENPKPESEGEGS